MTSAADAVVVKFEMVPATWTDAGDALAHIQGVLAVKRAEDLADAVISELVRTFGGQVENLHVEKGLVERRVVSPTAEPKAPEAGCGEVDGFVVGVAAVAGLVLAGLVLGACLVCSGFLVWRCIRPRRKEANRTDQGQANAPAAAAEAAATADETAPRAPLGERVEVSAAV